MKPRPFSALLAALLFAVAAAGAAAQTLDLPSHFTKRDVMIPMRDGVRLHTEIYVPKDAAGPLPFLLTRTPYGLSDDARGFTRLFALYPVMQRAGYIFVFQDIRGRYGSEGRFVMNRAPRPCFQQHRCSAADRDPRQVDESTDTYDTIAWLLTNVPGNNGRVGELGISYGGWLTTMAMLDPHPALKAVSEQASPADQFLGDDFHHNGAFRLSYGFEYAALMETGKTNFSFHFDRYDTYEWYLRLGPLSNANRLYLHGQLPTWNDFVNHPNYDSFWRQLAFAPYLTHVTVPILNVAGWYDQEDFYGPLEIYETLARHDPKHLDYLVVGPWNHGGWAEGRGDHLGPVQFGGATSQYFRQNVQSKWFAYWLKDQGPLDEPRALTFETGSNRWQRFSAWPPRQGIEPRKLYLHCGGRLSFAPPAAGETGCGAHQSAAFSAYLSDPANPVPYRPRPVRPTYPGPEWPTWLVQDQRFVDHRPDVLSFVTPPLDRDVAVAGDLVAHLVASTTGTDSDWIVKLIDVYPEVYPPQPKMGGYELIVADEVFRGRFRQSFEHPQPIVANRPTPYVIDLHANDHAFLKGHRIMVQIQSTWFPLIDRNPQRFVPNIFKATAADYQSAWQRVYHAPGQASYIALPAIALSGPEH